MTLRDHNRISARNVGYSAAKASSGVFVRHEVDTIVVAELRNLAELIVGPLDGAWECRDGWFVRRLGVVKAQPSGSEEGRPADVSVGGSPWGAPDSPVTQ